MKCNYCGRVFEKGPVKKVIRGKQHIFCSEGCYNLHFHRIPKFDVDRMYSIYTVSVLVPDIEELIEKED